MDFCVRAMRRRRLGKVAEIAIHVDVVFVGAPQVRETIRVQRVQEDDCHARVAHRSNEIVIGEQPDLASRTAKAFDAMRGRGRQQHAGRVGTAQDCDVDRQVLAIRPPGNRVHMLRQRHAPLTRHP